MRTRHRGWRTEGNSCGVSTRAVILATEAEVRKDLQRLCDDSDLKFMPRFERWDDSETEATKNRRRGFRRGGKANEQGIEAVLGLASLVTEAEVHKPSATPRNVCPTAQPKQQLKLKIKPPKPVKDAPKKVQKTNQAMVSASTRGPRTTFQAQPGLYPQMFPQQFSMPLFYPPVPPFPNFPYPFFKYPEPGFAQTPVMSMYYPTSAPVQVPQHSPISIPPISESVGSNSCKHVAIAKFIQRSLAARLGSLPPRLG